jgi:hypothetical protein
MNQPVSLHVVKPPSPRPRLHALARPILVFPHLLIVGGPMVGMLGLGFLRTGLLGALAWLIAVFDWFAILFTDKPVQGLQPLKLLYLRWRARVLAYSAFLTDGYPPFGDDPYPAVLDLPEPAVRRDRMLVLLRPILVLPHLLLLFLVMLVWIFVAVISWLCLSISGTLPDALWHFSYGAMDYELRVEAYALLVHDEFPSFSFRQEP